MPTTTGAADDPTDRHPTRRWMAIAGRRDWQRRRAGRRDRHVTQQTVSSQHICELRRRRVIDVVEADVEFADEEHWVDVRHYTGKYVRQLGEKRRRHRPSAINEHNDTR